MSSLMNPNHRNDRPWKVSIKDWWLNGKSPKHARPTPPTTTPFRLSLLTPPTTEPSNSPLLRLPRELRDQIYDHLFTNARFQYRDADISIDIFYGSYNGNYRVHRHAPAWLGTCKMILHEGLEQFYREAQCINVFGSRKTRLADLSPGRAISLARITRLDLSGKPTLLNFRRPHNSWHPVERRRGAGEEMDANALILQPSHIEFASAQHGMCHFMQKSKHSVKDLKLRFGLPKGQWSSDGPEASSWGVNLEGLDDLGSDFERVEFILDAPRVNVDRFADGPNDLQMVVSLYRMLQIEMERIGRVLVGGGWVVCAVRDWMAEGQYHIEVKRLRGGAERREINHEGLEVFTTPEFRIYRRVPREERVSTEEHEEDPDLVEFVSPPFMWESRNFQYPLRRISVCERTDGVVPPRREPEYYYFNVP